MQYTLKAYKTRWTKRIMKSRQHDMEVLVDEPRPTNGYLAALCVYFGAIVLVAILNTRNLPILKGVLFTVAVVLFITYVYRAYKTRYVLSDIELRVSNGFRHESIPLASIVSVTFSNYSSPLPTGSSRRIGLYCNRYKHQLFLTPSQPEYFKSTLLDRVSSCKKDRG